MLFRSFLSSLSSPLFPPLLPLPFVFPTLISLAPVSTVFHIPPDTSLSLPPPFSNLFLDYGVLAMASPKLLPTSAPYYINLRPLHMSFIIYIDLHCIFYRPFSVKRPIYVPYLHRRFQLLQFKSLLPGKLRTHN